MPLASVPHQCVARSSVDVGHSRVSQAPTLDLVCVCLRRVRTAAETCSN